MPSDPATLARAPVRAMKILIVQDFLRSGGTERQSLRLAGAFAAGGHPTLLLTFRPGGALDRAGPLPADPLLQRRSLQRIDLGLDWFAPGLAAAASRFAPDAALCMGRMADCYGARLQAALPDSAVVCTFRTGKPLPWMFRRSLGRVRHVVANSREARDALVSRHGLPADRVSVIYNSLLVPPGPPGPSATRACAAGSGPARPRPSSCAWRCSVPRKTNAS